MAMMQSFTDLIIHNGFQYDPLWDAYIHPDGRCFDRWDLEDMGSKGSSSLSGGGYQNYQNQGTTAIGGTGSPLGAAYLVGSAGQQIRWVLPNGNRVISQSPPHLGMQVGMVQPNWIIEGLAVKPSSGLPDPDFSLDEISAAEDLIAELDHA